MRKQIELTNFIRQIPDWPIKGILFRDITPLLENPQAFHEAVEALCVPFIKERIDYIAAVEARGFIFGSAVAQKLRKGLVPIRKKGKLPFETETIDYELEYGTASLEVHRDAVGKGSSVLMIDDLLATGGTMAAACSLIEKIGGKVAGISFLIELAELKGIKKIEQYKVASVIKYD